MAIGYFLIIQNLEENVYKWNRDPLRGFAHCDRGWTNHGLPRHRGQPYLGQGQAAYVHGRLPHGDVADRSWSTHSHRGVKPHQIWTPINGDASA